VTAELRSLPAYSEYRKARARLALISHAPTPGYDAALSDAPKPSRWRTSVRRPPVAHAGSHHVHSSETKIPRGSDLERRPSPPPPGSSDGDWDVWHLEVADWELCYQRRTLDWFDRQAERCNTEARLNVLRDQILEVVQAWLRAPLRKEEPLSMADSEWKRWVIESDWTVKAIVNRYGCSRAFVYRLRQGKDHVPPPGEKDVRSSV
jgi:hypothetical protein